MCVWIGRYRLLSYHVGMHACVGVVADASTDALSVEQSLLDAKNSMYDSCNLVYCIMLLFYRRMRRSPKMDALHEFLSL